MSNAEHLMNKIDNEFENYVLELKCLSKMALIGRAEEIAAKKMIWKILRQKVVNLKARAQQRLWLSEENLLDGVFHYVEDYENTPEEAVDSFISSIIHPSKKGVSGEEKLP